MHPHEALRPDEAFGSRLVAFLLDTLLHVLVFAAAGGGTTGILAALVVSALHLGVGQGMTGFSLGKSMTGARLAGVDTTKAPGPVPGLIRWAISLVDYLVVGLVVALTNDKRQRLGDRAARTWVIGLAPAGRERGLAAAGYWILALGLVAVMSFWTAIALLAIFGPMVVALALVVVGVRDRWAPWPWLVGGAFTFVPAVMMGSVTLCRRTGGACPTDDRISTYHMAVVAIVALAAAFLLVRFMARSQTRDLLFAGLVVFAELWVFWRLKGDEDLRIAAVVVLLLLATGLIYEVVRLVRRAPPELAPEPS